MKPRAKPHPNGAIKFHLYLPEEMYLALRHEAYLTGTTINKLVLRQLRKLKCLSSATSQSSAATNARQDVAP